MQTKAIVFEALRGIAVATGGDITQERIEIYCNYLTRNYSSELVINALARLLGKVSRFPSIADIVSEIEGSGEDQKAEAINIAGRILDANTRFSEYDTASARKFLGEELWEVVERFGGWPTVCKLTYAELGTARAQLRDLASAITRISKRENGFRRSEVGMERKIALVHSDFAEVANV